VSRSPTPTTPAPPLTPESRFTSPGFLLHKVGRVAGRWITDALAPIDLTPRQAQALLVLRTRGPVSQQVLGEEMEMDPSTLVLLLNALEQRGLIVRQRDPADRRRHIVAITDDGLERRATADAAVTAIEDRLLQDLEPADREQLRSLLLRVDEQTAPSWEPDPRT
jgi:DNA-binding MarR family transcriptional regulator